MQERVCKAIDRAFANDPSAFAEIVRKYDIDPVEICNFRFYGFQGKYSFEPRRPHDLPRCLPYELASQAGCLEILEALFRVHQIHKGERNWEVKVVRFLLASQKQKWQQFRRDMRSNTPFEGLLALLDEILSESA